MAHTNYAVSRRAHGVPAVQAGAVFISSRFIREIAKYGGDVRHGAPSRRRRDCRQVHQPSRLTGGLTDPTST